MSAKQLSGFVNAGRVPCHGTWSCKVELSTACCRGPDHHGWTVGSLPPLGVSCCLAKCFGCFGRENAEELRCDCTGTTWSSASSSIWPSPQTSGRKRRDGGRDLREWLQYYIIDIFVMRDSCVHLVLEAAASQHRRGALSLHHPHPVPGMG